MSNQLSIANVINISVSQAQLGLGEYNVNNLGLFTTETPANSFGTLGYQLYLDPSQVATDFGSNSETFAMANAVFSQQPNILAGGGYLAVIPFLPDVVAQQTIGFDTSPSGGYFTLTHGSDTTGHIANTAVAADVQTALRLLPDLSLVTVTGSYGGNFVVTFTGLVGTVPLLVADNHLTGVSTITVTTSRAGFHETLGPAVTRTNGLIQYFGVINNYIIGQAELLAAAAVVQPLNKMLFAVGNQEADIDMGGKLYTLVTDQYSQTRGLYYGDTGGSAVANCLGYLAAYAGRALSTNFDGSNTTETMHLKQLIGVSPDPTMTQSLLNLAVAAGADSYVSLQGVPAIFTSGQNGGFFDQVYNQKWIVGALEVSGFNYLAQSSTKVPQTESGMTGLKGSYRAVCQQAVSNQYLAPGQWNSSTTFGNQADFLSNIQQFGYYIYSQPISQQSQAARVARQAPLVQIALKQAGAIQESSVVIYVNA